MAFNITSYIVDGYRFPFLGTLPRPFTHYCLNNAIIPLVFFIFYAVRIIEFQRDAALYSAVQTILSLTGLLLGFVIMLVFNSCISQEPIKTFKKSFIRRNCEKIRKSAKQRRNAFLQLKKLRRSKVRVSHYVSITLNFILLNAMSVTTMSWLH